MIRPTLGRGVGAAGTTLLCAFVLLYGPVLLRLPLDPLWLRVISVLFVVLLFRSGLPRILGVSNAELGLPVSARTAPRFALGLGVGVGTLLLAFLVAWGAGGFAVAPGLDARGAREIAYDLALFAISALFEELLFRVGLLGSLRTVLPPALAVGISAAVFGLVHATNPEVGTLALCNTTLAGVLLGLLFLERRGAPQVPSLGLCTGFHFAWNAAQSELLGIPVSGYAGHSRLLDAQPLDHAWSGGAYGLEGGWGATLALAVACLWAARQAELSTTSWAESR